MKTEELRFDSIKHQYWIGKKRIPGVSEILQKVGLSKSYEGIDSFYRDRGIACHKAIELYLKGILDQTTLDDAIKPQFGAFLKFWNGRSEPILALETPMKSLSDSFAGTPDLITEVAIYDWKCSKNHDRVGELQGQAYKQLASNNAFGINGRGPIHKPHIVVELHDDGTFSPFDYGIQSDLWDCVMDLYEWRMK